jgi:outer membrane protein assembly factor BamB
VFIGDDRILVTAGYGAGSMVLEARRTGDGIELVPVHRWDKTRFACEQHTPIFYKNRLFTVMPNDAGPLRRQLLCMTTEGTRVWSSGKSLRFGLGPFMIAGDRIFVLDDKGVLTVAEASADSFSAVARAKVLHGRDAWAPMAAVAGRLLVRDSRKMVCLSLESGR